ncbi:hypothetical protein QGP82_05595 [Leptothoe sp. LEGE 181152]|nr:hypothetical protein [Leptothoe sp. LEGE 181152]
MATNKQKKSQKRLFSGMSYWEIKRSNSNQRSKLPKEDQAWLATQGYKNAGWDNVIALYQKINELLLQSDPNGDIDEQLFLKADRIGNKYQTPEEIAEFEKALNEVELAFFTEIAQLRKSISGNVDKVELSNNLQKVKFTSQVLKKALSQKNDINYKISNLYPFPLAYPYRNIYVEREYAATYDRQMKYGEHLLSFLASVGMSLVFEYRDYINHPLDDFCSQIKDGLASGLSPGHWRRLLQTSCNILREVDNTPLANNFSAIWFKGRGKKESEFAKNTRQYIVERLNDSKHGRGPVNTNEYKEFVDKQSIYINALLEDLDFISQCEMVVIDDIDTEWSTGKIIYKASLLRGDHPVFERVEFEADKSLSKEKLYIRFNAESISLYPFLSFLYNSGTKKLEIFSFDKKDNNGLMLKSFESGTAINSKQVYHDFRFWLNVVDENSK